MSLMLDQFINQKNNQKSQKKQKFFARNSQKILIESELRKNLSKGKKDLIRIPEY